MGLLRRWWGYGGLLLVDLISGNEPLLSGTAALIFIVATVVSFATGRAQRGYRSLSSAVASRLPWERKRPHTVRSLGYRTHRTVLWTATERNGAVTVDGPWCRSDHAALDYSSGGNVAVPINDHLSLWAAVRLICPTCRTTYSPVTAQGSQITVGAMRDEARRLYEATSLRQDVTR